MYRQSACARALTASFPAMRYATHSKCASKLGWSGRVWAPFRFPHGPEVGVAPRQREHMLTHYTTQHKHMDYDVGSSPSGAVRFVIVRGLA